MFSFSWNVELFKFGFVYCLSEVNGESEKKIGNKWSCLGSIIMSRSGFFFPFLNNKRKHHKRNKFKTECELVVDAFRRNSKLNYFSAFYILHSTFHIFHPKKKYESIKWKNKRRKMVDSHAKGQRSLLVRRFGFFVCQHISKMKINKNLKQI